MKVFGYKDFVLNEEKLSEMPDVTFQDSPKSLRVIAKFFNVSADYFEKHNDLYHSCLQNGWCEWQAGYPEIVIVRDDTIA